MEYKRLGDIASYINGYAFKPSDRGIEGLPIIRIQDLTGNAYDTGYYNGSYPKEIEINDGDVLISWSASLGVYEWNRGKALLNQHIFKVVFDKAEVNKNYFIFAIRNSLRTMTEKTHGATMKHITKRDFEEVRIPFPSLGDQDKIADILSAVEKIIEQRNHQLQTLDTLIKARFVEMFGDLHYAPSGNWPLKKIGELADVTKLAGFEFTEHIHYQDSGDIIMLRGLNCKHGKLDLTDVKYIDRETSEKLPRSKLHKGDILMTYAGTIGEVAMIDADEKYHLAPNVGKVTIKNQDILNSDFLLHLFMYSHDYIMTFASQVAQASINMQKIRNFEYAIPPIDLQLEFSKFATQVDKSKAAVQKSLDQTQVLMDSLMQQYFG